MSRAARRLHQPIEVQVFARLQRLSDVILNRFACHTARHRYRVQIVTLGEQLQRGANGRRDRRHAPPGGCAHG